MNKKLGNLASILYGKSPSEVLHEDGTFPIVGTGGVYGHALSAMFSSAVVVPRKGSLGNPQLIEEPFWPVDTTYAVIPNKEVDLRWLYYCLLKFDLTKLNEATGVPSISRDWLSRIEFFDPGKTQQKKIAATLRTIDQTIEKTEALIYKHQQIKTGLMHDLFTRGLTADGKLRPPKEQAPELYQETPIGWIPKEWHLMKLGAITPESYPICYGLVQPGSNDWNGVPIVAIHNLNRSFTDIHKSSKLIESNYVRSRIKEGDVLLSIKGTIGRVDIVPSGFSGNISRDVARIRPVDAVSSIFLKYLLQSEFLQREFMKIVVGTTRMELSINRLKKIPLYIPTCREQKNIAEKLKELDRYLSGEIEILEKLEKQKSGLMHDLLTGKVQVTIDKAETAHV